MVQNDALKCANYDGQELKTIQVQNFRRNVFQHSTKLTLLPDKDMLIWNDGGRGLFFGKLKNNTLQNVTLVYETKLHEKLAGYSAVYAETQPLRDD